MIFDVLHEFFLFFWIYFEIHEPSYLLLREAGTQYEVTAAAFEVAEFATLAAVVELYEAD